MMNTRRPRIGDWAQTYTGRKFYALDPQADDVDIIDIAHALSLVCRYGGHSREFYSVAEHCLLIMEHLALMQPWYPEHQLIALMHDAAEAYVGDMVRPLKLALPAYKAIEISIERVIAERFGLISIGKTPLVGSLDARILYNEAESVMPPMPAGEDPWHWRLGPPLDVTIKCLSPKDAEAAFLDAFWRLSTAPMTIFGPEGAPGRMMDHIRGGALADE